MRILTPKDSARIQLRERGRRSAVVAIRADVADASQRQWFHFVVRDCRGVPLELTIANAGHPFPFQIHNGQVRPLASQGQPLGASKDSVYEPVTVSFAPNDVLVWFTDGVVESENEWNEQFTEKRLRAVCQRVASSGARGVRDAVVDALKSFSRSDRAQLDDITLVVASIK